jgi:hypothetical protein
MVEPSVYIRLMPLLFITELGTESVAELRIGLATELGSPCSGARGYRVAEHGLFLFYGPQLSWGTSRSRARGCHMTESPTVRLED